MNSIRREIHRITKQSSPFQCSVVVESVAAVSDGFVRVSVRGDELAAYRDALPADAFKLFLPLDGNSPVGFPTRGTDGIPHWPDDSPRPVLRPYTVRRFDADRLRLDFDIAVHNDGVAMRWLRRVGSGDVVGLAGMRREFHAGAGVDRHLVVGDASALPAVAAIVESLKPDVPATVYLAAEHSSDVDLCARPEHATVHWIPGGCPRGANSVLAQAVRDTERPDGRTQAWIAGEAGVVRQLRRFAVGTLQVDRDDLHSAAYWTAGRDSTKTDEFLLDRYQREVAEGADVTDPDVREKVEFEE